jgi:DNA-binding transcriptional ArsR family regulator
MTNQQSRLNDTFHALADPTRRAVLATLSSGPATVSDLAQPFDMALPTFLQHLKVLEQCGLVRSKKVGRVRTCQIRPKLLTEAEDWIGTQRNLWTRRLDQLDDYLRHLNATESKK